MMIFNIITIAIISLSAALIIIPSPLALGLWILLLAITSTTLMSIMSSSWLPMIIFLIYIGALLVLFAYFLAIQPNHFINITNLLLFTIISFAYVSIFTSHLPITPMSSFSTKCMSIPFIIFNPNTTLIVLLGLILLLILLVVVNVTTLQEGPLRPYSYDSQNITPKT